MAIKVQCPNCLEPAEKTGNEIVCTACNATYKITQTGAAKVKQLGWKEDIERRVKAVEDKQAGLPGESKPEPEPAGDSDDVIEEEDDEDGDILPR